MLRILPLAAIICAVLFLTAYGAGIYPWTVCTVLLVFSATILLTRIQPAASASTPRLSLPRLYIATLALLGLLLVPLPLPLTRLTGPHRFEQNRRVVETLTSVRSLDVETPRLMWFSTTRNRAGTLRALLLLTVMFGGWQLGRRLDARQRQAWLRVLILLGTVVAVLGHLSKWVFPQGDYLWWTIAVPHGLPGPVGGFVNPNHFAGFVAMLAPLALAMAVTDGRKHRWFLVFVDVMALALMTLAILFSMSRGGVVAYVGGMGVLAALFFTRSGRLGKLTMIAALAVLLGAGLFVAFQNAQVRERLLSLRHPATTASLQERLQAWRDTIGMLRRYPVLGAGPNAFLVTYPQHRRTSSRAARDFAENEYVQVIGETGIVGAGILALFIWVVLRQIRTALARREEPDFRSAPAIAGAVGVMATHALVDFPLHLPLYAIAAATLLGFLWPVPVRNGASRSGGWLHATSIAIGVLALALGPAIRLDAPGLLCGARGPTLTRALVWAPTAPLIWRRLCAELTRKETKQHRHLGERCLTQAAEYDPNNYPLWRRLGEVRETLGDNRGANQAYRRVEELRDWIKLPVLPEE